MNDVAPSPLFRVWLLGPFTVERRRDDGEWEAINKAAWDKHPYARLLLQRLLCSSERKIERSDLIEDLWSHLEHGESVERYPSDAVYHLRKIMPGVVTTFGAASGYALAHQSSVWVDSNACEKLLKGAEDRGRSSAQALPLLEQANEYFRRGAFLEGCTGRWCYPRRATIERMQYRCRLWLSEAYEQQGMVGQAETALNALLEKDPLDEDILYRLVALFHRNGMTRQALRCFEEAKQRYKRDGVELSLTLSRDIETLFHSPRQRQDTFEHVASPLWKTVQHTQEITSLSGLSQVILGSVQGREVQDMDRSRRLILQQATNVAGASMIVSSLVDTDLIERFARVLAGASTLDETTLKYLNQRTLYYWHDRHNGVLIPADLLPHVGNHLGHILSLLERSFPPTVRRRLCAIAAKTALLYGVLLYECKLYEQARDVQDLAFQAAFEANDVQLQAICRGYKSFTWTYTKDFEHALPCVQEASYLASKTPDNLLQAWVGAVEAEIQAYLHNKDTCLMALQQAENKLTPQNTLEAHAFFNLNITQFQGYRGVCLQQFYQKQNPSTYPLLQEAQSALEQAVASDEPGRRKITYLGDLSLVYARQHNIEQACFYASQCIEFNSGINMNIAQHRLIQIAHFLQPYQKEACVQALHEQAREIFDQQ